MKLLKVIDIDRLETKKLENGIVFDMICEDEYLKASMSNEVFAKLIAEALASKALPKLVLEQFKVASQSLVK